MRRKIIQKIPNRTEQPLLFASYHPHHHPPGRGINQILSLKLVLTTGSGFGVVATLVRVGTMRRKRLGGRRAEYEKNRARRRVICVYCGFSAPELAGVAGLEQMRIMPRYQIDTPPLSDAPCLCIRGLSFRREKSRVFKFFDCFRQFWWMFSVVGD